MSKHVAKDRDLDHNPGLPEGFTMVPMKPTMAMIAAGQRTTGAPPETVYRIWTAMLNAGTGD